jgi:hypothetical protein
MGDIADGILNGDFDSVTGEWLGEGDGYPRTHYNDVKKSEDLSWKQVTLFLNKEKIKQHLHPVVLKDYGCKYSGKSPLRNACFEVLIDFNKFKIFVKQWKKK